MAVVAALTAYIPSLEIKKARNAWMENRDTGNKGLPMTVHMGKWEGAAATRAIHGCNLRE